MDILVDAQWNKCHGKQETKWSGGKNQKGRNTSNKAKNKQLKKQRFRPPSLYPGKQTCSLLFKEREVQKNGEKRSAEGTPLIPSSSVPNQPEFSNVLTHLQELYSEDIEVPFQLVLYKVCKITEARPKRNCHST